MKNYIRNFYPQKSLFESLLSFDSYGAKNAEFGLSGNSIIKFSLNEGNLFIGDKLISSLDKYSKISPRICSNSSGSTIWLNDFPAFFINSGANFNCVFCNSPEDDFTFSEKIFGTQPQLNLNFSGWQNNTGVLRYYHNGSDTMLINSISAQNSLVQIDSFQNEIESGQTKTFNVVYSGFDSFSGTGVFLFNTNAGRYSKECVLSYQSELQSSFVNLYLDKKNTFPSSVSKFFIENDNPYELELNISLYPTTGFSDEIFIGVNGSGVFTRNINEIITGLKVFPTFYSGDFTGIGGRLNNTGISNSSGDANLVLFAEGPVSHDYSVIGRSTILGEDFFANITGNVTGLVGPNSGSYYFSDQVTASGVQFAYNVNNEIIYPNSSVVFTGSLDVSVNAEEFVSEKAFNIFNTVDVSEGTPDFFELWNIKYNDPVYGEVDFKSNGIYDSEGYGPSGYTFFVPAKSRSSGELIFSSNFTNRHAQAVRLRVTDFTSIDKSIQSNI
jgi:hypothetical protein